MKAVLPALARPLIEPHLPADLEVTWFANHEEATAMVADADIAWVDMQRPQWTADAVAAGTRLKWVSTIYAGLDAFPLPLLKERGTVLTNGVGINAVAVAEYAVMGVLAAAKRFDEVVRNLGELPHAPARTARRLAAHMLALLEHGELEDVYGVGLDAFLERFLKNNIRLGEAVQAAYMEMK